MSPAAKGIPGEILGTGGTFIVIILMIVFGFVIKYKPVAQAVKADNGSNDVLNKFVAFIENSLSGLVGKSIDATRELHRDVAGMAKELSRTHEKVGQIIAQRSEVIKDIENNTSQLIEHNYTHLIIPRIEKMEVKFIEYFEAMNKMNNKKNND